MRKVIIEMIVGDETKEENSFEQKGVKRKRRGISLRQGERALFEKWAKRARKGRKSKDKNGNNRKIHQGKRRTYWEEEKSDEK